MKLGRAPAMHVSDSFGMRKISLYRPPADAKIEHLSYPYTEPTEVIVGRRAGSFRAVRHAVLECRP